jgi:transcription initiation factor IIE alpha subunit
METKLILDNFTYPEEHPLIDCPVCVKGEVTVNADTACEREEVCPLCDGFVEMDVLTVIHRLVQRVSNLTAEKKRLRLYDAVMTGFKELLNDG